MKIARKPTDEKQRLAAIKSLNLPNEYNKEALDRITHLASIICNTPVALVTLLTENDQLFLSKKGIATNKTKRDVAFCSHTIIHDKNIMVVPDTMKDPRFSDNPLVTKEPNIRFYAGVPIKTADGYPLGSLCVIDNKPSALNEDQSMALQTLALHVNHIIELQEKNNKLLRVNEQLEDAYKSLESFSYSAAHDLREPIKSIESSMRYLMNHSKKAFTTDERELLELTVGSAEKLNDLVEDLLTFSKQHAFSPDDYEAVDIHAIIDNVKTTYAITIKNKNVTLSTTALPVVKAHRLGLQIVFHNLIGNALKYHREGVAPKIVIAAQDMGSFWEFSVTDNGIGFSNEFAKEIFKPFFRLHSTDAFRGSGLGLALTQKIITRHGGEIMASGTEGKGSVFTFTLAK
jgi:signal transduction histidine kinase